MSAGLHVKNKNSLAAEELLAAFNNNSGSWSDSEGSRASARPCRGHSRGPLSMQASLPGVTLRKSTSKNAGGFGEPLNQQPSSTGAYPSEEPGPAPAPTDEAVAVFVLRGVRVKAVLTKSGIRWTPLPPRCCLPARQPLHIDAVPYDDILSADVLERSSFAYSKCCPALEYQLIVHTFQRSRRRRCLWRPLQLAFSCSNPDTAREWATKINAAVRMNTARPRSLLVLLNPYGGRRAARTTWNQIAAPVFHLAGCKCLTVETESMGHAHRVVAGLTLAELEAYDGIVAVGGDGLFQEVINGLLELRGASDERAGVAARLRLGHIPAGSTDAVACSLNGTRSELTAALHIALGDRMPLDVMRVDTEDNKHRFAVCVASYGYMGDLMRDSERLRWLGPQRYTLQGALTLVRGRSYRARVAYLPAASPTAAQRMVCTAQCALCHEATAAMQTSPDSFRQRSQHALAANPDAWVRLEGEFKSIMAIVMPCRSDQSTYGLAPYSHLADGVIHLVLVHKCSIAEYLRFLASIPAGGVDGAKFPYVHTIDCTAVQVHPIGAESSWNVDGELLDNNHVTTQVHRGLVDVFSRGIEA